MKQYIVDAFTDRPFSGNPAAVCVMDSWPPEESMMKLAMENNLSETAFIVKEEAGYHLRWFTPGTEVELCGHATLASSFVILNFYEPGSSQVSFDTLSGRLTITRRGDLYEMDLPTYELKEIPVTDEMERAFGARPIRAVLGLDLVCIFESEDQVRNMEPDQSSPEGYRTLRQKEAAATAYPGAFAPSLPYPRTRSAAPPTARSPNTGRRNWGRKRSLPIRLRKEGDISTAALRTGKA